MAVMIEVLKGMVLPRSDAFRRDCIVPRDQGRHDIDNQYDFHTLLYDAFYIASKRSICLICPKLLNFEALVRQGRFTADGEDLRIASIWHFKRYAQIWLRCRRQPSQLRFRNVSLDMTIDISPDQSERFRALNCAVVKSKNNDLRWIRDWAEYNVRVHKLQGVIFFDNGSSRYEPSDVYETLRMVPGLAQIQVISAPFGFGCTYYSDSMFFQVSMMNIARLRFCRSAAAVLCTDLDELVSPLPGGAGIFSATRRSPLGYLLFRGRWRETKLANAADWVRHADHFYRRPDDMCPATKYCINPRGICGFSHWDVHGAVRGFLKNYLTTSKIEYWHCRQISTHWKHDRSADDANQIEIDRETATVFGQIFKADAMASS